MAQEIQRLRASEHPPRKVVVATMKSNVRGNKAERVAAISRLLNMAEEEAKQRFDGRLDLVVLPEFCLHETTGPSAREQAIAADDPAIAEIGTMARRLQTYIVLPITLKEGPELNQYYNAALLLDRTGEHVGTYRKAYPVEIGNGVFENGVTPGRTFEVFNCDFGKLGIQICWDMSYETGWEALADAGAEIIALPSASPQAIRPATYAQRYQYWVVNATPRDNATIYNPAGMVTARTEDREVLVDRIDLSSAVVHWSETIEEGRAFAKAFGQRGGYVWSSREDTGLFWSNDPSTPVAEMLRQLQVIEMDTQVTRIGQEVEKAKKGSP